VFDGGQLDQDQRVSNFVWFRTLKGAESLRAVDNLTCFLSSLWLYMAAPIVGAIVAAFRHMVLTRLAEDRPRVAAPASVPAE
jgi:hypothetical protein